MGVPLIYSQALSAGINNTVAQQVLNIQGLDFWDYAYQLSDGTWFSPGNTGPTYNTLNSNSYVTLDGSVNPGLIPPSSGITITKQVVVDAKKSIGANYSTNTTHGVESPKFDINILIWTADQWMKFKSWIQQFVPIPGKATPQIHSCIHPMLQFHNITYLQVWGIEGPKQHTSPKQRIFTLKCIQSAPPSKKSATNTATQPPIATVYDSATKTLKPPKLGFNFQLKQPKAP